MPLPSLTDLPNPGIEPKSPVLQADSLPSEPPGKPTNTEVSSLTLLQGNLPNPGIEPGSPALQVDSLPAEPPGKPLLSIVHDKSEAHPLRFYRVNQLSSWTLSLSLSLSLWHEVGYRVFYPADSATFFQLLYIL